MRVIGRVILMLTALAWCWGHARAQSSIIEEAPLFGQEGELAVDIKEPCSSDITPNGDGDGDGNADDKLIETETDAAGNTIELWCLKRSDNPTNGGDNAGGYQFGLKYKPAGGAAVWIGRCKFLPAKNAGVKSTSDGNFSKVVWKNRSTVGVTEGGQSVEHRDLWEYTVGGDLKCTPQKRPFDEKERDYDKGWTADGAHTSKTGSPPGTFTKLIEDFSTGTTQGPMLAVLQAPCACCQPDSLGLYIRGTAAGGACSLYVLKVPVGVATSLGQYDWSVAASLVSAINSTSALSAMGVQAASFGNLLQIAQVGGDNTRVVVADAGLHVSSHEVGVAVPLVNPGLLAAMAGMILLLGGIARARGRRGPQGAA